MRVAIEADRYWANPFGIGRFVRGAVAGLRAAAPQYDYQLFALSRDAAKIRRFWAPGRVWRGLRRAWWLRHGLAARVHAAGSDVLFCPDYLVPRGVRCPAVAVVHDLLFLDHPEWGEPLVNYQLRRGLPQTLRRARQLVVPSEWVRQQVLRRGLVPPARVSVVPEGIEPVFAAPAPAAASPAPRFFLSVGTWSPRKNLPRLVAAFAQLARWYDGQLVLVGGGGWPAGPLQAAAARAGLQQRVVLRGFVSDAELAALYARADALVFPSLYEGFGLPVVEAMAAGCPVIASQAAAVPEVAGDGACLIDPHDVAAMAAAMRRMVQDAAWRAQWQQAGRQRAASLTWAQTGQRLARILAEAAG